MMREGYLASLEGGEGSGKTGVLEFLRSQLEKYAIPFSVYHDPGDTLIGSEMRDELLHSHERHGIEIAPRAKIFAFAAARAELAAEKIRPDLSSGRVVLIDRFIDSTTAIQGFGEREPLDGIAAVNDYAIGVIRKPDLTMVLDVPAAVGLWRKWRQGEWNDWEKKGPFFHERVRRGFLSIAQSEPDRVKVINAWRPQSVVQAQAWMVLADGLAAHDYMDRPYRSVE